ncbi:hypothetical protein AVEN_3819-1 [Araneus ventricosus]|uniref:Uncharacterized protein n=1 Tax=Araneus ventricosus TaxID=182803 RepID=A0A4Y2GPK2_ARAVE|nr:hypothetical protein AVEN_3819-1 [Araneus ventricosus]
MDILRDTGASIDIVSRNHVRPENVTGETVWIKQSLDLNYKSLPLAKVELQSPEFGYIVTKGAVIDAQLGSGWYLLSNKSHQLILEAKRKPNLNAVITRSQTRKTDPSRSRGGNVAPAEEPVAVVGKEYGGLVEISSNELRKAQRDCPTLQTCVLQAEKENSEYQMEGEILFRKVKRPFWER